MLVMGISKISKEKTIRFYIMEHHFDKIDSYKNCIVDLEFSNELQIHNVTLCYKFTYRYIIFYKNIQINSSFFLPR